MAKFDWKFRNQGRDDDSGLRYPSDLTDHEWSLVQDIIPPARRGGNKRTIDIRSVVNGLMYVLSTGCQWTAIPKDVPPRTTLNDYFRRWDYDGTLVRIHRALGGNFPGLDQSVAGPNSAQQMMSAEPVWAHASGPRTSTAASSGRSISC